MAKTKAAETAGNSEVVTSSTEAKKNEATGSNEARTQSDDSVYTVDEFARASATVFSKPYSPDIVRAAFFVAGKKSATKAEAEEIIRKFASKEVK